MKTFESETKALSTLNYDYGQEQNETKKNIVLFPEMWVTKKLFTRAATKKSFLTIFPAFFPTHFQISKQL